MPNASKTNIPDPEIPVWVEGRKKWVTGITKRTTFDDIIFALLRHQVGPGLSDDLITDRSSLFCIVEARDDIERPIKGTSKVLKVWRSWSSARARVTLYLRRITTATESPVSHLTKQQQTSDNPIPAFFQRFLPRSKKAAHIPTPGSDQCAKNSSVMLHANQQSHQSQQQRPRDTSSTTPDQAPAHKGLSKGTDDIHAMAGNASCFTSYDRSNPVSDVLDREKLISKQTEKIHSVNRQIRRLEENILSMDHKQDNARRQAEETSSGLSQNEQQHQHSKQSNPNMHIPLVFPKLSPFEYDKFADLADIYHTLTNRVLTKQKQSSTMEGLLNHEIRSWVPHEGFDALLTHLPAAGVDPCSHAANEDIQDLHDSSSPMTTKSLIMGNLNEGIKHDVCLSRELTRLQCKQIHDLDLSIRELDSSLSSKLLDIQRLEKIVSGDMESDSEDTFPLNNNNASNERSGDDVQSHMYNNCLQFQQDHEHLIVSERAGGAEKYGPTRPAISVGVKSRLFGPTKNTASTWLSEKPLSPVVAICDNDSGINSMASEETHHHHHHHQAGSREPSKKALETLV